MTATPQADSPLLRAYLLGSLAFDDALRFQRVLAFQLSEAGGGVLLLCEHPPLITVGRHGGPSDIHLDDDAGNWQVRWVARGGGCVLHLPGQLAVYPVLPLRRMGLGVVEYLARLHEVIGDTLADFSITADPCPSRAGVWVADRLIASVGIGVRDGVSLFGAVINVDCDLLLARRVRAAGESATTSIARERKGPLRAALVRQRVLEHFARRFGFDRTEVMFHPPGTPGHQRIQAASQIQRH